jgi:hypothetical protein
MAMIAAACCMLALASCKDDKEAEDKPIAVQGVTVLPDSLTVRIDEARPTVVTVVPLGADQQVAWYSADTTIAVANGSAIRGVNLGTTIVTIAAVADQTKTAEIHVTVTPSLVQEIAVDLPSATIITGESLTITPTVSPATASQELFWSVDDPAVATVENGVITGRAVGTTVVTVTSVADPGKSARVNVTIIATPVGSVTVAPSAITLVVGQTQTVVPTVLPAEANQSISWSVDYPGIATVNNGVIEALSAGVATVKVASATDPSKFATVEVTVTLPTAAHVLSSANGLWEFEDASNLTRATIGHDLTLVTTHPNTSLGTGAAPTPIAGPTANNKAITMPVVTYFAANHGIAANGGGARVNQYTMMFDLRIPSAGKYYAFFNTELVNLSGNDDADLFIRNSTPPTLGGAGTAVTACNIIPGTWHRLVVITDLTQAEAGGRRYFYVDGVRVNSSINVAVDNIRGSLSPDGVLFFEDNNREDSEMDVATVAIWGRLLTPDEAQVLGLPQ